MSRYNDPAHLPCQHKDRPNVLSLPSLGNPHCCRECWDARMAGTTPFKGKREAWEIEFATGADDTEYMRNATGRQHWDRGNF